MKREVFQAKNPFWRGIFLEFHMMDFRDFLKLLMGGHNFFMSLLSSNCQIIPEEIWWHEVSI